MTNKKTTNLEAASKRFHEAIKNGTITPEQAQEYAESFPPLRPHEDSLVLGWDALKLFWKENCFRPK